MLYIFAVLRAASASRVFLSSINSTSAGSALPEIAITVPREYPGVGISE